jgi:hypothetical protein
MNRFADFKKYKNDFLFFSEPFSINVEHVREDLKLELIDLQFKSVLKSKFETVRVPEMFKYLGNSYPKLKKHFSNILSMFGSSYVYEQLFSLVKLNKSKSRNQISNVKLLISFTYSIKKFLCKYRQLGTKEKISSFKCSSKIKINKLSKYF